MYWHERKRASPCQRRIPPRGLTLSCLPSPAAHRTAEMLREQLLGFELGLSLYSARNNSTVGPQNELRWGWARRVPPAQGVLGAQSRPSPTRQGGRSCGVRSALHPQPWADTPGQETVARLRQGRKAAPAQGARQDKAQGESLAGESAPERGASLPTPS